MLKEKIVVLECVSRLLHWLLLTNLQLTKRQTIFFNSLFSLWSICWWYWSLLLSLIYLLIVHWFLLVLISRCHVSLVYMLNILQETISFLYFWSCTQVNSVSFVSLLFINFLCHYWLCSCSFFSRSSCFSNWILHTIFLRQVFKSNFILHWSSL